ncbi:hypothetical protein C8Q80DRAFT_563027 [Daedaleopsis nitida]|nr:hypothetical protein C8Q80DRAFT_563027 [Daedaleopsis nitida]
MSQRASESPTPTLWSDSKSPPSSPPPSAQAFVPRPRLSQRNLKVSYSTWLSRKILPEDTEAFRFAKPLMRTLVYKVLDPKYTWCKQRPEDRRELYSNVLSAYPAFEKYEDHWPVWYYCANTHAVYRHSPPRHIFISVRGRAGSILRSTSTIRSLRDTRGAPLTRLRGRRDPSASPAASSTSTSTMCSQSFGEIRRSPMQNSDRSSTVRTSACGHSKTQADEKEEVVSFLRSVVADFDRLLDRFVSAGLSSGVRLIVFAGWDKGEREDFLRTHVRLDPFERKMIGDALDRIR